MANGARICTQNITRAMPKVHDDARGKGKRKNCGTESVVAIDMRRDALPREIFVDSHLVRQVLYGN